MKVEFFAHREMEEYLCAGFITCTSNIRSLGCFVLIGDDNSSYSKMVDKTYKEFGAFCLFCFGVLES